MENERNDVNNLENLTDLFLKKRIKKGTVLLREGERFQYGYQVISGCLRSFVLDNTGKEHIIQFAPEGWMLADINTFINRVPSVMNIDAIEDSEVIVYDKRIMAYLEDASKDVLLLEIKRFQNSIITHHHRIISLLSSTAEQRYLSFMATYPSLYQRLPLKLIASYLGMTPEYLSDVRRKLTKK